MNSIDWYANTNFDASIILNFPKGMSGVMSALTGILSEQKKYVVEHDNMNVDLARKLVEESTGSTYEYHLINSQDPNVWGILRNPVNEDSIRVIGVFHGEIPDSVPENVITIDIGRSLHRKVPKNVVNSITDSIKTKGKFPNGKPEELYYGLMTLCYEVLFKPEYTIFPKNVRNGVYTSVAFDYMYNPPEVLNEPTMKSAVINFVDTVHGYMG